MAVEIVDVKPGSGEHKNIPVPQNSGKPNNNNNTQPLSDIANPPLGNPPRPPTGYRLPLAQSQPSCYLNQSSILGNNIGQSAESSRPSFATAQIEDLLRYAHNPSALPFDFSSLYTSGLKPLPGSVRDQAILPTQAPQQDKFYQAQQPQFPIASGTLPPVPDLASISGSIPGLVNINATESLDNHPEQSCLSSSLPGQTTRSTSIKQQLPTSFKHSPFPTSIYDEIIQNLPPLAANNLQNFSTSAPSTFPAPVLAIPSGSYTYFDGNTFNPQLVPSQPPPPLLSTSYPPPQGYALPNEILPFQFEGEDHGQYQGVDHGYHEAVEGEHEDDDDMRYRSDGKRARRYGTACAFCRRRKMRCDSKQPVCTNCREHGQECSYVHPPKQPRPTHARIRTLEKEVEHLREMLRHSRARNKRGDPQEPDDPDVSMRAPSVDQDMDDELVPVYEVVLGPASADTTPLQSAHSVNFPLPDPPHTASTFATSHPDSPPACASSTGSANDEDRMSSFDSPIFNRPDTVHGSTSAFLEGSSFANFDLDGRGDSASEVSNIMSDGMLKFGVLPGQEAVPLQQPVVNPALNVGRLGGMGRAIMDWRITTSATNALHSCSSSNGHGLDVPLSRSSSTPIRIDPEEARQIALRQSMRLPSDSHLRQHFQQISLTEILSEKSRQAGSDVTADMKDEIRRLVKVEREREEENWAAGRMDCDVWPPDLVRQLLGYHFDACHPAGLTTYRPLFFQGMATSSGPYFSKLLLNVVLLSTVKFSSDPRIKELDYVRQFYQRSKELMGDAIVARPSMATVAALLLLMNIVAIAGLDPKLAGSIMYMKIAAGMINELGINVNDEPGPVDLLRREGQRRLVWCAYALGILHSVYQGRAVVFAIEDVRIPLTFTDSFAPTSSEAEDRTVPSFKSFIRLLMVIERILSSIYGKGTAGTEDATDKIDAELKAWAASLAPYLRFDPNRGVLHQHPMVFNMHAMHQCATIILHRPRVESSARHPDASVQDSWDSCLSAALAITQISGQYGEKFGYDKMPYLLAYCAYVASTILVRKVAAEKLAGGAVESPCKASLVTVLESLDRQAKLHKGVQASQRIIQSLMQKLNLGMEDLQSGPPVPALGENVEDIAIPVLSDIDMDAIINSQSLWWSDGNGNGVMEPLNLFDPEAIDSIVKLGDPLPRQGDANSSSRLAPIQPLPSMRSLVETRAAPPDQPLSAGLMNMMGEAFAMSPFVEFQPVGQHRPATIAPVTGAGYGGRGMNSTLMSESLEM